MVAKAALERELQSAYAPLGREGLLRLPAIEAYTRYYKRYGKTYHVLHQLESVALKGRPITGSSPLVEAMFMAELKNHILTAGHDLLTIRSPLKLEVTLGTECYSLLRGQLQHTRPGDMMISDAEGTISTVLYGPDQRTQITPTTEDALFITYSPAGIQPMEVRGHLDTILAYVRLFAPDCEADAPQVICAST